MSKQHPQTGTLARLVALERIYSRIPQVACRGLCAEACGPISMAPLELAKLESAAGVLPKPLAAMLPGFRPELAARMDTAGFTMIATPGGVCPLLTEGGRCSQYQRRPAICRLYGAAVDLRCEYGCAVDGAPLTRAETERVLRQVEEVGR